MSTRTPSKPPMIDKPKKSDPPDTVLDISDTGTGKSESTLTLNPDTANETSQSENEQTAVLAEKDKNAKKDDPRGRKTKIVTPKRVTTILPKRPAKANSKCCSSFPCCLELPLEIGVQLLCVVDLITSVLSLVIWTSLLGMDLFAHKHAVFNKTEAFHPPSIQFNDPFATSTTTKAPPWTVRPRPTEIPVYDYDAVDLEIASSQYSKIAEMTKNRHEIIEQKCGFKHLEIYLFTYELEKTNSLWQGFLVEVIAVEMIYILLSIFLIMSVCCFIEHRGSKLLVMVLWWVEWVPIFLEYEAMILSQSKRLCILEHGFTGFRGQIFLLVYLAIRTIIFKPYQLLVHYFYIKELLIYGYLKDESVHQTQESEYSRDYFAEFYTLEVQREGGEAAEAYQSTNTSHALSFDHLRHADVATVQHNVMTAQDDPLSIRNREIRDMQSGKIQQNIKSVRHS